MKARQRCAHVFRLGFLVALVVSAAAWSAPGIPAAEEALTGARLREALSRGRLLGTAPDPGTNTVLVSHGFNLWDAEGFHLGTQGEAAIYRPDGQGRYALVARLTPSDWAELPQPMRPAR